MKINNVITDRMWGFVLILICMAYVIFSKKFCDGDITPVLVLVPIAVCGMMNTNYIVN